MIWCKFVFSFISLLLLFIGFYSLSCARVRYRLRARLRVLLICLAQSSIFFPLFSLFHSFDRSLYRYLCYTRLAFRNVQLGLHACMANFYFPYGSHTKRLYYISFYYEYIFKRSNEFRRDEMNERKKQPSSGWKEASEQQQQHDDDEKHTNTNTHQSAQFFSVWPNNTGKLHCQSLHAWC